MSKHRSKQAFYWSMSPNQNPIFFGRKPFNACTQIVSDVSELLLTHSAMDVKMSLYR
jgi:hypothetical protein